MMRLIRTELRKYASVPTTWFLLAAAVVVTIAAVAGALASFPGDVVSAMDVRKVIHPAGAGAIFALVGGIVTTTGEFRHGTIVETMLAEPNRNRLLTAKMAAGMVVRLVTGLATSLAAAATVRIALTAQGSPMHVGSVDVWGTLLGVLAWSTVYALIGVAVGMLTRNQAGAIVGALAWLLVLEQITISLASSLGKWLPGAAAEALGRVPADGLLPQWGGGLVLIGYAVALAAGAGLVTLRRDVT